MTKLDVNQEDHSENIKYNKKDYPIYIARDLLSSFLDYEADPHWHDDLEFTYILDGEMEYNINGEIVQLNRNEAIFVNSRQIHYGFSSKHKECDFFCVVMNPKLLCARQSLRK
jgi:AraC family transcriptional regulator, melibiose operon regulatory protein